MKTRFIKRTLDYFFFVLCSATRNVRIWQHKDYWVFYSALFISMLVSSSLISLVLSALLLFGITTSFSVETFGAVWSWLSLIVLFFFFKKELYERLRTQFPNEQHVRLKAFAILSLMLGSIVLMFILATKAGMYTVGHVSAIHKYTRLFTFH